MLAAGARPLEPYPGSAVPWTCQCLLCESTITPTLGKVRSGRRPCRVCSRARAGELRRLSERDACLEARSLAGVTPLERYPGLIHSKWKCRCNSCGSVVEVTLHNIRAGHGACRKCGHARGGEKRRMPNDEAAIEIQGTGNVTPLEPYPGRTDVPWRCQCNECGAIVSPTLGNVRMRGGSACKPCGTRRGSAAQKIPEGTAIDLMRSRGADPTEPYPGFGKRWKCVCTSCGREVSPTLGNALKGHNPCSHCTGNARYSDEEARHVMVDECNAKPLEPYPGANRQWRCECQKCHREITPTFANARSFGACKYCAEHGFDYTKQSVVYLLALRIDDWLTIAKVGIANVGSGRLKKHQKRGWQVVDVVTVPTGEQAKRIESAILKQWRSSGAEPISRLLVPSGDGWTETANTEDLMGITPDLRHIAHALEAGP
jgi:hypothetical protein